MTEADWETVIMRTIMAGIFDKLKSGRPLTREQTEIHEFYLEFRKENKQECIDEIESGQE
jgi:hypothetical protein